MNPYRYQVGGSLPSEAPSYVERAADRTLYAALKADDFCYVLNARQMGKSSLMVRASHQLQREGYRCAVLDMTRIGSDDILVQQWYKGIATELWDGFNLFDTVDLKQWWRERESLSPLQQLSQFIDALLFTHFPNDGIVIFVDEIDATLSLPFSTDDFFALIRSYYNQRSHRPVYKRLSFVLLGVATPSDLVKDRRKTPFNIGHAVSLKGFQPQEAQPLLKGLADSVKEPQVLLEAVLYWTGGQPFLTQKVCSLLDLHLQQKLSPLRTLSAGETADWVEQFVRSQLIEDWESQDEPEHLRTIRDRLLSSKPRVGRLLSIYQRVLSSEQDNKAVAVDGSREQSELLLSGLVIKQQSQLKVKNRLYAEVFDDRWIAQQLAFLRPYSQAFDAWIASEQRDDSRLLHGQALRDATAWVRGKSLSDLDYQFLASSEALDRQETQKALELARAKEIVARQREEKKRSQLQKVLIGVMGMALLGLIGFSATVRRQNRAISLGEIDAIATSSEALLSADKDLEAMVAAIEASRQLQALGISVDGANNPQSHLTPAKQIEQAPEQTLSKRVRNALRRAVYRTHQYNVLSGHSGSIRTLAYSPDGGVIASASEDNTAKLWQSDGTLIATLAGHTAPLVTVDFSADGEQIITTSEDKTAKLWNADGTLITTFTGHAGPIWCADFSPDGQIIVTGSGDKTLKLWRPDGTLMRTFDKQPSAIFEAEFSPDGQTIATANASQMVELWQLDGTLRKSLGQQASRVSALEFSAAGQYLATANVSGTVKLWDDAGNVINTFAAHTGSISGLDVSPDGQQLVTASSDKTVKLWQRDGTLLNIFAGHGSQVYDARFSPDGETLASAGFGNAIRLWRWEHPLVTALNGHGSAVLDVDFSPDGQVLVTTSADKTVKLWQRNGTLMETIREHRATVREAIFSPDGRYLVTAGEDGIVNIWQLNQSLRKRSEKQPQPNNTQPNNTQSDRTNLTLINTLEENQAGIWGAAFSPDSEFFATSSIDGIVKLRRPDGTLVSTLTGHTAPVWNVAFSTEGEHLATVSSDNQAKIWRSDGTEVVTLMGEGAPFFGVAFSPDGKTLVTTSSDASITLWQLDTLMSDDAASQPVNETIDISEVKSTQLKGHTAAVFNADFSPDGQIFATVSGDNTLRLWGTDSRFRAGLEKHNAGITSVSFSPDGKVVATASDDKTALLWDVEQAVELDLLAYSCEWVKDYLRTSMALAEDRRSLCED